MKKIPGARMSGTRKVVLIILGALLLFLLGIYLLAAFSPTGYESFAREKRVSSYHRRAYQATAVDAPASDHAGSDAGRDGEISSCSDAFDQFEGYLSGRSITSLTGLNPLLDSGMPYYQTNMATFPLDSFSFDSASEVLRSESKRAIVNRIESTNFAPYKPGNLSPESSDQMRSVHALLDQVEAIYLEQDWPIPAQPHAENWQTAWLGDETSSLFPACILRARYRGEETMARDYVARALYLNTAPIRDRLYAWGLRPAARLEFLALMATEQGLIEPGTLEDIQNILMGCLYTNQDLEAERTAIILARVDAIGKEPDLWLEEEDNAWPIFLGGYPHDAWASIMRPVLQRRIERHAMAIVRRDEEESGRSREALIAAGRWMNRKDADEDFSSHDLEEVDWHLFYSSHAPFLYDATSWLNKDVCTTIILLASCRHRLERGAWPETPEALVPEYLDAQVLDSPTHAWHCATIPITGCDCGAFAVVLSSYVDNFRYVYTPVDLQPDMPLDPESPAEPYRGPDQLQLFTNVNLLPLYEPDFRRLLAPETVEGKEP